MRPYAAAQQTGTRDVQCDAAAIRTAPRLGARAAVILDGIGDTASVRAWTQNAAPRLAYAAARRADAEAGLRAVYDRYAADPATQKAAAIVAVVTPGRSLTIAWAGDCRAYLLPPGGRAEQLTQDHNRRRVCNGNRHSITSYLGSSRTDQEVKDRFGHPAVESVTLDGARGRLLLVSDGTYEPYEDERVDIAAELGDGLPLPGAVRRLTRGAVRRSVLATRALDPSRIHADNATALLLDL
ncbi:MULTISPECIES: PP2C family protein-serine/threonine phosphatase [unclassified Streptomyces]|uniref:PP2C family protein-serine/threonine phosphatase n=1 Tax=unclassified Streptomyces TaxID=2593676 RepID=UPI0035E0EC57